MCWSCHVARIEDDPHPPTTRTPASKTVLLSILGKANENAPIGSLVTVQDVCMAHWKKYGRNYYCRYDYEGVAADGAKAMMAAMEEIIANFGKSGELPDSAATGDFVLKEANNFEYSDPIDGSVSLKQLDREEVSAQFVFKLLRHAAAGGDQMEG